MKPRMLRSLIRDHLLDEKRPFLSLPELASVLSLVKTHGQSIKFENFNIQSGTDTSLVPMVMATLNLTVKISFRNTRSFFDVHVTSTPIDFTYYQLVLATKNMKEFYHGRKSQRNLKVAMAGNIVPLNRVPPCE